MKKWLLALFILVTFTANKANGQTIVQTYLDPCDGKVYTVSFPLPNQTVTVVVRGKVRSFSFTEASAGAIQVWVNQIFSTPCPSSPVATAAVATTVSQAASSAASAASSSAASAAASSAAASTPSAPTSSSTPSSSPSSSSSSQQQSSSGGSSSSQEGSSSSSESSSSGESSSDGGSTEEGGGESKSESKSEKKSGGKSSDKKKSDQKKSNPPIIKADLSTIGVGGSIIPLMNIGVSRANEDGTVNWNLMSSVRMDLKQIVVGGGMSSLIVKDGKVKGVTSTTMTYVTNWKDEFIFYGYSYIRLLNKGAVAGLSISGNEMLIKGNQLLLAPTIILFYTRPVKVSKFQTFSPEMYVISSPVTYAQKDQKATYDRNVSFFTGGGTDINFTKRFKLNLNLKFNISTNKEVPIMGVFSVGSKINL